MATIGRRAYAEIFGPTVGDRVRLADTDLIVEVEADSPCAQAATVKKSNLVAVKPFGMAWRKASLQERKGLLIQC